MPECYRCHRVQPTAEVRRTSRGWLCKENAQFTRCWFIVRELAAAARAERRAQRREAPSPSKERAA